MGQRGELGEHAEIVAEKIAHLAAVFEEVAVADVIVADVVLDDRVVGVVDGGHAVERTVDAAAADRLARGIAAVVPVERIAAEQAFLTHPIIEVAGVRRDEAPEYAAVHGDFEGLATVVRIAALGDGEHQTEFPRAEGDGLRRGGVHVLEEEHLIALGGRRISSTTAPGSAARRSWVRTV